jgi:hypothetical protein
MTNRVPSVLRSVPAACAFAIATMIIWLAAATETTLSATSARLRLYVLDCGRQHPMLLGQLQRQQENP